MTNYEGGSFEVLRLAYADEFGGKAAGLYTLEEMGYRVPEYVTVPAGQQLSEGYIADLLETFDGDHDLYAVRSSANVEDGSRSSFAGQFDSFLGVQSSDIGKYIDLVRGSAVSERVRKYCELLGHDPEQVRMNVIVQAFKEPISAGVWMGSNQGGGVLEWTSGRGEAIVGGTVVPITETYHSDIISESEEALRDENQKLVAATCVQIQQRIQKPVDLEFCLTEDGLQWVQLRMVTRDVATGAMEERVEGEGVIIGDGASAGLASGSAYRYDTQGPSEWGPGKILVTRSTTPEDMLYLMTANGVVTEMGGRVSHAAVVCRELGKACVVGVDISRIDHNSEIKIDGSMGRINLAD